MPTVDEILKGLPSLDSNNLPSSSAEDIPTHNLVNKNPTLQQGDLGSFLSAQTNVYDFGIPKPKDYTDYGVAFSRFRNQDMDRANNQTWYEQAAHSVARMGLEGVIGQGISAVGALGEVAMMAFQNGETDFDNAIISLGNKIQEASREALPIYQTNPGGHFQWGDFGWWAENAVSVGSSLGLLIPAMGVTKGLGALGEISGIAKGLGKVTEMAGNAAKAISSIDELGNVVGSTSRLARGASSALEAVAGSGDAAKYWAKVLTTSVASRHAENFAESFQQYASTKQMALDTFVPMSDDQFSKWKETHPEVVKEVADMKGVPPSEIDKLSMADHIANKSGWETYKVDAWTLAADVLQIMPAFKGFKFETRIAVNPKKVVEANLLAMGETMTKETARKVFFSQVGHAILHGAIAEELGEGVEEGTQAIGQNEGTYYGQRLLGTINEKGGAERLASYLKDPSTWEQAFWGVAGGVAFSGGTRAFNKMVNITKGVSNDRLETMRTAEIAGRQVQISRAAVDAQMVNNGINHQTGEAIVGTEDEIAQQKEQLHSDIVSKIGKDLGFNAAKHGNIDLLLDQLKSPLFKKELVEKYQITNEEEATKVLKNITDNVLTAEKNYKYYYNKLATTDVHEGIKDALISDAMDLEHSKTSYTKNISDLNHNISVLKGNSDYQSLLNKITNNNLGKPIEQQTNLEHSLEHAATTFAIDNVDEHIAALEKTDNIGKVNDAVEKFKKETPNATQEEIDKHKELMTTIFEAKTKADVDNANEYKKQLEAKVARLEKDNVNGKPLTYDQLLIAGVNNDLIQTVASRTLSEVSLKRNENDFNDLFGNIKAKAKEKLDAFELIQDKETEDHIATFNKAIDDAGDDTNRLTDLARQIKEIESENQLVKSKFKPLYDKINTKVKEVNQNTKLRESAIRERDTYIDQLRKTKGTIAHESTLNRRSQKAFTDQFNKEDLDAIDNVIKEGTEGVKPPVGQQIDLSLVGEFTSFISSDITPAIMSITSVYNKLKTNTNPIELRLTTDDIKRLKEFKLHMITVLAKMDSFKSLGEIYDKELAKVATFLYTIKSFEADKTVINIDKVGIKPDIPIPTIAEEAELIQDQELIDGINQIANNLGIDTTLKAEVGDEQGQKMLEQTTFGLNIIRMLALQNAGLARGSELNNTNYPFSNVLSFIYNKVNKDLLSNPIFVDTLRNLFNNVVNSGIIAKEHYVENRIDINDFINTQKQSEIQSNDLKEDLTMFISSTSGMNKNTKNGDVVANEDQVRTINDLNDLQIGDEVTVEVDVEKSGTRGTDVLQADMKITHNGIVIGHLNRVYNSEGVPTSFHGGMPYTTQGSWTDAAVKHLANGKLVSEFELMKQIKDARMKTGLPFNQLMDEYGQALLNSPIINELVNYGRKENINPIDNRNEYYNAVNHIMNTFSHGTINNNFNSAELIKSLNNWNNRVRSDIANGLKLRNDMKTNGVTSMKVPIKDKTSGSTFKAKDSKGNIIHRSVDKVFGSAKNLILMATGKRKSSIIPGESISTINGKKEMEFADRVYHEGTIYVIGKVAKSKVNPLGLMPFDLKTTDITDARISDKGKEYNNQLVKWITDGINNITNTKGTFTDTDILKFVTDLKSKVLGVESVEGKVNKVTINNKGKHYTITFSKTVTSIFEGVKGEKGKKIFDSNDTEYSTKIDSFVRDLKRNVPLNKDNQLDNHNDTDSKDTPIYKDVVTGKTYGSFTEYAVDTELLVTDYGAVVNGKGEIVSNSTVDPTGMFNDGQRMIVSLDQGKGVKIESKPKSSGFVYTSTYQGTIKTWTGKVEDNPEILSDKDDIILAEARIEKIISTSTSLDQVSSRLRYVFDLNTRQQFNKFVQARLNGETTMTFSEWRNGTYNKESSKISEIVSDDTAVYGELFDMAKEAGATFSDEVVDDAGYAQIDRASLVIRATKNFLNANLTATAKQKFLAHEALHAITLSRLTDEHRERLLDIDDSLRKAYEEGKLDSVLNEGERKILQQVFDAIGTIGDEVLTYAFTNSIYARALNAVASETQTKETRTLWDMFMRMIADIIPNTKLSEIKDIMNEVMGVQDSIVGGVQIKAKEEENIDEQDKPLDEEFDGEHPFFVTVSDKIESYLGTSVVDYMKGKSKGEREFLRSKINNGTIVFKC